MFKVGDRIFVKSSPTPRRQGHYGTVVEFIHGGRNIRAKMDDVNAFSDCMFSGHYTISIGEAERNWVLAGAKKSNRGFAKFIRQIEEVA